MEQDFQKRFEAYTREFDGVLSEYLSSLALEPKILDESVRYSLQSGGKRVRPVLMFAAQEMLGGRTEEVYPYALALELIHTYSLIHDDLPAMDNDDYRRGRLSNHKVFGEGQAILAGDALLNEGYRICFSACAKEKRYIDAATLLCENAGANGMIAGQAADLYYEGRKNVSKSVHAFIVENKTAKMITSALAIPAIICGAEREQIDLFSEYGKKLGILFQLTDDILDVTGKFESLGKTVGKDEKEDKLSAVSLYGLQGCVRLADDACAQCLQILDELPYESSFLREMTRFVRDRKK